MSDVKSTDRKRRNNRYATGDYPCLRGKLGLPELPPGGGAATHQSRKGKSRLKSR